MRDRVSIRKTAPQEWTVTWPRLGFGDPEVTSFASWAGARDHVVGLLARLRWGSTDTGTEPCTSRSAARWTST
ncbi:hypothetical protein [Lentzea guizhouensis]|uniref:hypothetical protein n=1 Tax=Lentzea guizhouensis TaxID=1586287 RepID=UPI0012B6A9A9|nr:hypothetical protein [Lentzea guizhouensis]